MFLSVILAFSTLISTLPAQASENVEPRISFCATLQIVSSPNATSIKSGSGFLGHSFLIVKNTGNATIKVGHMSVPVGNSITIGTFGNRDNHKGIWYNIEGYNGLNGTRYGLTTALTGSQLNTLNKTINANDKWSLTRNCSYFAKKSMELC